MKRSIALILLAGALLSLSSCKPAVPVANSAGTNPPAASSASTSAQTSSPASTSGSAAAPATPPAPPATRGAPLSGAAAVASSGLHSPKTGTTERKAILAALRVPVEATLKQPVVFKVEGISVKQGWAFVQGEPLRPDGRQPDYTRTQYAQAVKDGLFGYDIDALLRFRNGVWAVVKYYIGATDVEWSSWAKDYGAPVAVFPKG